MTNAVVLAQSAGVNLTNRNRIINGDMRIDQRNAGAEVNPAVTSTYYLDRWLVGSSIASKFKIGQNAGSVTPPEGFVNYLGCTSLSAYTVGAGESFNVQQRIEGFNIADLGWGTASAKTVTLSFQVYSSLTGTFGGSLRNNGGARSYPFSYSVSVANTWSQISITIAGDTSGTWLTTSGIGMYVTFSLGTGANFSGTANTWATANYIQPTGSVSVVGTSGATFYITGVQLEAGSVATPFEYVDYGRLLQMCQRYFEKSHPSYIAVGTASGDNALTVGSESSDSPSGTGYILGRRAWKIEKRATPTVTLYDATGTSGVVSVEIYGVSGNNGNTPFISSVGASSALLGRSAVGGTRSTANVCSFHYTASSEL